MENTNQATHCSFKKFIAVFFGSIIALVIVWHLAVSATLHAIDSILNIARSTTKSYISSEFGETDTTKKHVVLTQNVTVEISKEKDNRILWDWVSVGSSALKVKFIDNKVQYYIAMADFEDQNIQYDPISKTIQITVPPVKIDKDMVSVATEKDKVLKEENESWSPFGPNIEELNDDIMNEIKKEVLRAGFNPLIREKAQAEAKIAMESLFNKILGEFLKKEGLKLQVIVP